MPYYTGDAVHYRGDYYRGDYYRGSIFSFVGKALGGVAKVGVNLVRSQLGLQAPAPSFPGVNYPVPQLQAPAQTGFINIGGQGPQTGLLNFGGPGPIAQPMIGPGGMPIMRGYHLNRSTYETRGGGTSRWGAAGHLAVHQKGTVLVRNRHRNVGNARALKHALSRVSGFARLARRVMTFTHPRAGKGHFKFRRKKR